MLDRDWHGCPPQENAAGQRHRRTSIEPLALSFDYPRGRADILVMRLGAPEHDLSFARAALARQLIARRADCAEDDVAIVHDAQGAPRVTRPQGGLHVSMAGRDAMVAAAVADHAVGVDIEPIGAPFAPPLNILHPAEIVALAQAGTRAHEFFLRIWTLKEAYVKALGTGLAREPAEIEIGRGSAGAFDRSADFDVIDRGRVVRTAAARAGRFMVGRQPVMLACIILPR